MTTGIRKRDRERMRGEEKDIKIRVVPEITSGCKHGGPRKSELPVCLCVRGVYLEGRAHLLTCGHVCIHRPVRIIHAQASLCVLCNATDLGVKAVFLSVFVLM